MPSTGTRLPWPLYEKHPQNIFFGGCLTVCSICLAVNFSSADFRTNLDRCPCTTKCVSSENKTFLQSSVVHFEYFLPRQVAFTSLDLLKAVFVVVGPLVFPIRGAVFAPLSHVYALHAPPGPVVNPCLFFLGSTYCFLLETPRLWPLFSFFYRIFRPASPQHLPSLVFLP